MISQAEKLVQLCVSSSLILLNKKILGDHQSKKGSKKESQKISLR